MKISPDLHHRGRGMDKPPVVMGLVRVDIGGIVQVLTDHLSRDAMKTLVIGQGRRPPMATDQAHMMLSHEEDRSTEISTSRIVEDIVRQHHSPTVVVESRMASLGVRLQVWEGLIANMWALEFFRSTTCRHTIFTPGLLSRQYISELLI